MEKLRIITVLRDGEYRPVRMATIKEGEVFTIQEDESSPMLYYRATGDGYVNDNGVGTVACDALPGRPNA